MAKTNQPAGFEFGLNAWLLLAANATVRSADDEICALV